ncbi:MAG: TatD family hydrolase [Actinobacteria bacterium]|nr:TatD family hydrolase [Actinomycetota bacterium]
MSESSNLVDSHCHLDLLKDPTTALSEAKQAGVSHMVTVGIDLSSSGMAVEAATSDDRVYAAVGIHPNASAKISDSDMDELARLAGASDRVVAIGETGLDFYRDRSPRQVQENAFRMHMDLARETGLPLMVHSREASEQIMELLEKHSSGLQVILHCFSLHEQVEACAERGYFMSIAGNVTFPKATGLRDAVSRIPANLLLTETDSPFLAPVPKRGHDNSPAYIRFILDEIAAIRGVCAPDLARQVNENFLEVFGLNPRI